MGLGSQVFEVFEVWSMGVAIVTFITITKYIYIQ